MWVATHVDLFRYFPASAADPDARPVAQIYVSASTFELAGHGFSGGEIVRLTNRAGSLPTGLTPLTWYTVASVSGPDFFTLSVGGAPVVLTDGGSGTTNVKENFLPKIDLIMAEVTSYLVANAKAYRGQWMTPPLWAPRTAAHLAAPDVAEVLRVPSGRYDVEATKARAEAAEKFVELLRQGMPADDGQGPIDSDDPTPDCSPRVLTGHPRSAWRGGL